MQLEWLASRKRETSWSDSLLTQRVAQPRHKAEREKQFEKEHAEPCFTGLLKLALVNTGPQVIVGTMGSYIVNLDYKLQTDFSMGKICDPPRSCASGRDSPVCPVLLTGTPGQG